MSPETLGTSLWCGTKELKEGSQFIPYYDEILKHLGQLETFNLFAFEIWNIWFLYQEALHDSAKEDLNYLNAHLVEQLKTADSAFSLGA